MIWEINQSLVPNLNTQAKTLWHKLYISAKTLLLTWTTNQAFFLCCKTSCQSGKMRIFFSIFREYLRHINCQARKNSLARRRERFSKFYSWGKGLSCYLKPWKENSKYNAALTPIRQHVYRQLSASHTLSCIMRHSEFYYLWSRAIILKWAAWKVLLLLWNGIYM